MKRLALLALSAVFIMSCEDDTKEPESIYKQDGYFISTINETSTGYTYYAGHFGEKPGGTSVDMTKQSTYEYMYMLDAHNEFMYGPNLAGENFLTKLAVTKENGKLVEVASFPLTNFLSEVKVINDELGFYALWGATPTLSFFNPTTMEKLGDVDVSKGMKISENERNYYNNIIYRPQDNRLFLTLITDNDKTGQFYDATDIYVDVVNVQTKTWEKTITYKGGMDPMSRGKENTIIDENGNIFIFTQGSYGLDGRMGGAAPVASRPQILKIPANATEFDATYSFNPVNVFGKQTLLVQLMLGSIYDANGIAYSCISTESESPRILELVMKLATNTITEDEYFELRTSVFYSQNQRWVKLDLHAKSVTVIDDIPATAGFAYPNAFEYDNKFYLQFNATAENASGFYEYDPATGKASKVLSVGQGGIAVDFIRLGE